MPIKIPEALPGRPVLERERVPLIFEERALRQDIRPMQVALLNLMPDKIRTETQILRAIGGTPLQVEATLLRPATHTSKNTPAEHLQAFYKTIDEVKGQKFDGMIITGAPLAHLPFEEVTFWDELTDFMEWTKDNVFSSFYICWGAQAALHHFYNVPRHYNEKKLFGVYPHRVINPYEPLTAGFDHVFNVPVSRHTEIREEDVKAREDLKVMVTSDETGLCLLQDESTRRVFMFNHLEYDNETLKREYERDRESGAGAGIPYNYFPDDDPAKTPLVTWRAHRNLLYHNWINMIYQGTPFKLDDLPNIAGGWRQVSS